MHRRVWHDEILHQDDAVTSGRGIFSRSNRLASTHTNRGAGVVRLNTSGLQCRLFFSERVACPTLPGGGRGGWGWS